MRKINRTEEGAKGSVVPDGDQLQPDPLGALEYEMHPDVILPRGQRAGLLSSRHQLLAMVS